MKAMNYNLVSYLNNLIDSKYGNDVFYVKSGNVTGSKGVSSMVMMFFM